MKYRKLIILIVNIILILISFFISDILKTGSKSYYFLKYLNELVLFLLVWILCSLFFKKYTSLIQNINGNFYKTTAISNLFAFTIVTSIMYVSRIDYFSRTIVLGTCGITSILELMFGSIYLAFDQATPNAEQKNGYMKNKTNELINGTLGLISKKKKEKKEKYDFEYREKALLVEINKHVFDFVFSYAKIESPKTLIIDSTSRFNIDMQMTPTFDSIVNFRRINDIRYLNKFFEASNHKLEMGGLFIDFVETKNLRKKRILGKYLLPFNFVYYFFDYIIKRVFPKFLLTKRIYFFLTRGNNRVLTKAETFGRLYSCGFEILTEKFINNHLYFVARKISTPRYPKKPTYGPLVKLERIGKGGKMIKVYKMRTMHPYAEYLQEYIYHKAGLAEGGKFKSDFRVSSMGKILRTFWLDEFPMLINLFKGELKLFGVRPLSKHYFNLYPKELQERRIKYKPGLIPPFYVHNPKTLEEIVKSEMKYLDKFEKHPFITDFRYFFIAIFNIIFKRYRSK